MKYFKNIDVIENKPLKKLVITSNKDNDFLMEFRYEKDKINVSFLKSFMLDNLSFWGKIKYCYKILFNKKIVLDSVFEFKNGEHVLDVSDMLYIYSKEVRK